MRISILLGMRRLKMRKTSFFFFVYSSCCFVIFIIGATGSFLVFSDAGVLL